MSARIEQKKYSWVTIVCISVLSLIVAARGNTGDTENYIRIFSTTLEFPLDPLKYYSDTGVEWIFGIFSWFLNQVGLTSFAIFFLYSFLTFYFLLVASQRVGLRFVETLPYYLSSFFLIQQFVQIRQGLAVALIFALIPLLLSKQSLLKVFLYASIAFFVHSVSILPLITAWIFSINKYFFELAKKNIYLWSILIFTVTILVVRVIMSSDIFSSVDRLSSYQGNDLYNGSRDIFSLANIRGILLVVLMLIGTTKYLANSRIYILLLGLYVAHMGLRFSFYDFLILSGRLSTSLSFAEVFILPLLVREHFQCRWVRGFVAIAYMVSQGVATYNIQVPTLVEDYFTPF